MPSDTVVCEALRAKGLKVERFIDHFDRGTPDVEWLPVAGQRNWISLTKDSEIRRNIVEREKVVSARVRQFTLNNGSYTGDEMADLFIASMTKMGRILKNHRAPFIAVISRTDITMFDIDKLK